jgi:hypothetical protein
MAKRKGVITYVTTMDGRKVAVTVPENPDPVQVMVDAIKDNVSPAAVATIIAYLQPVKVKDKAVQREVEWFSEKLVEAVGGNAALNQLMDEVGL